jgi:hypothetical protein
VSVASATTDTATTSTYKIEGTTPLGATVTQTVTDVTTTPAGPQGVALEPGPPLGSTNTTIQGQTIDGIQCNRLDQLAYQAYAHLQVYFHGHPRALPGAIGLVDPKSSDTGTTTTYRQGLCTYWVATTAADGIIAVRSPLPSGYTLGDLFAVWGEPLGSGQVVDLHGPVTAWVNGRRWPGNPRTVPLREHEAIELAVGGPVPPHTPIDWAQTDL